MFDSRNVQAHSELLPFSGELESTTSSPISPLIRRSNSSEAFEDYYDVPYPPV